MLVFSMTSMKQITTAAQDAEIFVLTCHLVFSFGCFNPIKPFMAVSFMVTAVCLAESHIQYIPYSIVTGHY